MIRSALGWPRFYGPALARAGGAPAREKGSTSLPEAEEFASHECRIFGLLSKAGFAPDTVFDVGASNGTWLTLVSAVFPDADFELFEPLAGFVPAYRESLKSQLRDHPKFSLHEVALGSSNGPVTMRVHPDGFGSTTLDMGDLPGFQQKYEVPQYVLDDYVERFALPLPDLIKIDTQGSEGLILANSPRCVAHAKLILVESWLVRGYGPETPLIVELIEMLGGHDYDLAELGGRFYDENHRLYCFDAFFLKRSLLSQTVPLMPTGPW